MLADPFAHPSLPTVFSVLQECIPRIQEWAGKALPAHSFAALASIFSRVKWLASRASIDLPMLVDKRDGNAEILASQFFGLATYLEYLSTHMDALKQVEDVLAQLTLFISQLEESYRSVFSSRVGADVTNVHLPARSAEGPRRRKAGPLKDKFGVPINIGDYVTDQAHGQHVVYAVTGISEDHIELQPYPHGKALRINTLTSITTQQIERLERLTSRQVEVLLSKSK